MNLGFGIVAGMIVANILVKGGGISINCEFFFKNIIKAVKKYLISPHKSIHIVPATSGENASLIGTFSLIPNKILNFETNEE